MRVGSTVVSDKISNEVLGYFVLALAAFGGAGLAISLLSNNDLITAFSASATTFGNVGPGLGDVGPRGDFLVISRPARLVAIGNMLLGRLEIYPVLLALVHLRVPRMRLLVPGGCLKHFGLVMWRGVYNDQSTGVCLSSNK